MKKSILIKAVLGGSLSALPIAALFGACKSPKQVIDVEDSVAGSEATYMPKARIYRTTGECSDLVPVTLSADGSTLISYPAPSDLSVGSEPVRLADGWWLDRRGVSPNSRFTNYTYAQYRNLKSAPSPSELMENLNGDCGIAEIRELPVTLSAASADTEAVNRIITENPEQCKTIYKLPILRIN